MCLRPFQRMKELDKKTVVHLSRDVFNKSQQVASEGQLMKRRGMSKKIFLVARHFLGRFSMDMSHND